MYNLSRQTIESMGQRGAGASDPVDDYRYVKVLDTYNLCVYDGDESVTPCLKRDGFWESWITSWFTRWVRPGMTVIDIGANCGYYTMLAAKLVGPYGHVVAYEPNPIYVEALERTRKANKEIFMIRPFAVAQTGGKTDLYVPKALTGSASIVKDMPLFDSEAVSVERTFMDWELDHHIFERHDIVKIDAEGAEQLVWQGGRRVWENNQHTTLLLEWTPGAYTPEFITQLMEWGDVSVVTFDGGESRIGRSYLNSLTDWKMIVVRRT